MYIMGSYVAGEVEKTLTTFAVVTKCAFVLIKLFVFHLKKGCYIFLGDKEEK
jgi:hypothetical protein